MTATFEKDLIQCVELYSSLASLSRGTFVLIETLAGEYIIGEARDISVK